MRSQKKLCKIPQRGNSEFRSYVSVSITISSRTETRHRASVHRHGVASLVNTHHIAYVPGIGQVLGDAESAKTLVKHVEYSQHCIIE